MFPCLFVIGGGGVHYCLDDEKIIQGVLLHLKEWHSFIPHGGMGN